MENTKELFIEMPNGESQTHIIIDHGNGQFTSMLKTEYERRQAEQSTPNLSPTE